MPDRAERKDEKGLSARFLILIFVMGVAACAVFFSLGFLVGYTERPSSAANTSEEVAPSSAVPPLVNPPLETQQTTPALTPVTSSGPNDLPTEQVVMPQPGPKPASQPAPKPSPVAPKVSEKPTVPKATHSADQRKEPRVGYTVQVAASREKKDAEKLVKELRSRGFDVFVVPPQYSDAKDDLYRVQVGPYATRDEAARIRERIAKEGFKPFIKQ